MKDGKKNNLTVRASFASIGICVITVTILCLAAFMIIRTAMIQTRRQMTHLKTGQIAPDFELDTLDGEKVSLKDFTGHYVLLLFWAEWCNPCKNELKEVQELYANSSLKLNLTILTIHLSSGQDLKKIKALRAATSFSFPILLSDSSVEKQYGVSAVPRCFLINPMREIIRTPDSSPWIDRISEILDKVKQRGEIPP